MKNDENNEMYMRARIPI